MNGLRIGTCKQAYIHFSNRLFFSFDNCVAEINAGYGKLFLDESLFLVDVAYLELFSAYISTT